MYCLLRMELAAYLQENAILSLSQGGAFEPFFKPNPGVQFVWTAERHRRAFAAFSKQNDKYPTNARGGIGTLGIDWAITWILCP